MYFAAATSFSWLVGEQYVCTGTMLLPVPGDVILFYQIPIWTEILTLPSASFSIEERPDVFNVNCIFFRSIIRPSPIIRRSRVILKFSESSSTRVCVCVSFSFNIYPNSIYYIIACSLDGATKDEGKVNIYKGNYMWVEQREHSLNPHRPAWVKLTMKFKWVGLRCVIRHFVNIFWFGCMPTSQFENEKILFWDEKKNRKMYGCIVVRTGEGILAHIHQTHIRQQHTTFNNNNNKLR